MWIVRHSFGRSSQVLQRVRRIGHTGQPIGGVQAGNGVVRRCGSFDGHRCGGGAERLREIMAELLDRSTVAVKRYGGSVNQFTGDGIMAVFGAPITLEDHAVRACLAALGIQDETVRWAAEVKDHDGIDLRLRVGLNSGQVIAGAVGSGSLGYTTIGEQVGMAQRMESVAPPGG